MRQAPRGLSRAVADEDDHARERWLVSYADFITLLFAFFVVLYSVSSLNSGKFQQISESLSTVFSENIPRVAPVDLGGGAPPTSGLLDGARELAALDQPAGEAASPLPPEPVAPPAAPVVGTPRERVEAVLAPFGQKGEVKVRQNSDWLEIELGSEVLFATGSAALNPAGRAMVDSVGAVVADMGYPVRVEGFTDDVPLRGGPFGSNWGLSAARAATIAERLAAARVPPTRLSAVGYGEFRPVADNSSAEGRRRNRRVVIAVARHEGVALPADAAAAMAAMDEEAPVSTGPRLRRVEELPGPAEPTP